MTLPAIPMPVNRLLALLDRPEIERLAADLHAISIRPGQSLQRQGAGIERVYFLHGGLCSISRETFRGETVEVASVGSEGVVGVGAAMGKDAEDNTHATMIVAGDASWMNVAAFRREIDRRGLFHDVVQQYVREFVSRLEIEAACHALHPIDQRLARWLLSTADRLNTSEIPVTHETVASVLGVRRASITVATSILEHLGLVEHGHRRIRLRDRHGLKALACECYDALQSLPQPDRPGPATSMTGS